MAEAGTTRLRAEGRKIAMFLAAGHTCDTGEAHCHACVTVDALWYQPQAQQAIAQLARDAKTLEGLRTWLEEQRDDEQERINEDPRGYPGTYAAAAHDAYRQALQQLDALQQPDTTSEETADG